MEELGTECRGTHLLTRSPAHPLPAPRSLLPVPLTHP